MDLHGFGKEEKMTLNEYRDAAYKNAKEHGWHNGDRIPQMLSSIALIHSELGECTEAVRRDCWCDDAEVDLHELSRDEFAARVKDTVQDELADVIIRVLDLCGAFNIDIEAHVIAKMKYNEGRPYRHGGKLA